MSGAVEKEDPGLIEALAGMAQGILNPQAKEKKEIPTGILPRTFVLHKDTDTVQEIIDELTASDDAKRAKYVIYTNPAAEKHLKAALASKQLEGRQIVFVPQRISIKSRLHPRNPIFLAEHEVLIQTLDNEKLVVLQEVTAVATNGNGDQAKKDSGFIPWLGEAAKNTGNTILNMMALKAFIAEKGIQLDTRAQNLYNRANADQIAAKIAWVEKMLKDEKTLAFLAAELPENFYTLPPTKQYEILYKLLSKHTQDASRVSAYDESQKQVAELESEAEKIKTQAEALKALVPQLETAITTYKDNAPKLAKARIAYLEYRLAVAQGQVGGLLMYPGGAVFALLDVARVMSKKEPAATLAFLVVAGGLTIADTSAEYSANKRLPPDLLQRFGVYTVVGSGASVMSVMALESMKSLVTKTLGEVEKKFKKQPATTTTTSTTSNNGSASGDAAAHH
jgi:hypothetical protein